MITNARLLIPQAEYVKRLRPLLAVEAFVPEPSKFVPGMNSDYYPTVQESKSGS